MRSLSKIFTALLWGVPLLAAMAGRAYAEEVPAPENLSVEVNGSVVTFSWDATAGLYYNLVVYQGSRYGLNEYFDPEDIEDGQIVYTTDKIPAGTWSWVVYTENEDGDEAEVVFGPVFTISESGASEVPAPENLGVTEENEGFTFAYDAKAGYMYTIAFYMQDGTYITSDNLNTRPLDADGTKTKWYSYSQLLARLGGEGTYKWSVTARSQEDESSEAAYGPDFTLGEMTACEAGSITGFGLYPNPATGAFTLSLPATGAAVNVEIFGLDGKIIESRENVSGNIRFCLNRGGIYLVRVSGGNTAVVKKVVVR